MSLIEIKDLRKVYHVGTERIVALNRINLSIDKGEICCIFGTSDLESPLCLILWQDWKNHH